MRAIRIHEIGGPEVLQLEDVPEPRPEPGQVLIRVACAGLNYADTLIRRGRYLLQPAFPYVPGLEVSGTVAAIGSGVDAQRFPLGGRVAALTLGGGGYAELAAAKAAHTIPLPDALSLDVGAAFPMQAFSVYHALTTAGRLAPGDTVLVHAAAGGAGTLAVQLAKLLGAGRVIGTAGGLEKVRLVRELGADAAIDYLREDFPARVNEITEGRGADLILESVGGQTLERSFECLAVLGRVVTFGNASGSQADLNSLWGRLRTRCQALCGANFSVALARPELRDPSFTTLLDYLASGRLKVIIKHRHDLANAGAAQAAMENRKTVGKILLRVVGGQ